MSYNNDNSCTQLSLCVDTARLLRMVLNDGRLIYDFICNNTRNVMHLLGHENEEGFGM